MGRRIHKSLSYERCRVSEAECKLKWLSKTLYFLDELVGKSRRNEIVNTYGCGIEFKGLREKEYKSIRQELNHDLGNLSKEINTWGVTFIDRKYKTGFFDTEDKEVEISVEYKWGLPSTCEIVSTDEWVEMDEDKVKVDTSGKVFQHEVKTVIDCDEKVMMKAVFEERNKHAV